MLFDPIACGDSHLLSSPHAVGGDPEVWVSGGFETRPYGFFGAARRAAAGYLSLLVQRKSICFSRIACGDVEQLSCGTRRAPTGWRIKNQNRARSAHNQDVAVDVGTRSRRRASQPRPGEVASRCLSRARFVRSASSARARPGREAQGVAAAPGRAFFGLPFFARAKKGNPPPRGERHHCFSSIAAGDSTRTSRSAGYGVEAANS